MFVNEIIYENKYIFSELLYKIWDTTRNPIVLIANYKVMMDVVKELLDYKDLEIGGVLLTDHQAKYFKEYMMVIGDNGKIVIGPAYINNEYIVLGKDSLVFVMEDINSKFVIKNSDVEMIEVDYMETMDEATDNGYITEVLKDDKGIVHGFTRSKTDHNGSYYSESFYSTNSELAQEMLHNYRW